MLTADLTPFEESFYFYQRRLNMRTALPFTRYFYHKKDSPSDLEWKAKQLAAGESYTGFGKRQWADELLVGDNSHKSEDNGYKRLVETTVTGEDATLKEVEGGGRHPGLPLSRRTKADEENDRKSLDRAMSKTLYFLVKTKEEEQFAWKFPETVLVGRENLKEVGCADGWGSGRGLMV